MKKTAVVICPGRGTYNKDELGYLKKYHADKKSFIASMDAYRRDYHQESISDLDSAEKYSLGRHSTGDNASALIYSCAMADIQSIDRDKFDIVGVTGNSMGWYLALAAGGATSFGNGLHIVNTMGTLMHREAEGGQVVFPLCNDQWQQDDTLIREHHRVLTELAGNPENKISQSIELGLTSVLAASKAGVKSLLGALPKTQERYPFSLPNHAAFHSELMRPISDKALKLFDKALLNSPKIPLIDGRGHIWQPHSTDIPHLFNYTFDHQVCETYYFSKAIEVACKEFAPDCLIILGPGTTLGPPTAQQLIKIRWRDIIDKPSFKNIQNTDPFVLSMGIEEQRKRVIED